MSWKDEEIDELFKQAKTPEAPAFEEAFWTEMEAMLPPQQKRRKAGFWWISAATVAILAIGGAALWQTQGQTANTQTTGAIASKKPVAEQLSETDEQAIDNTTNGTASPESGDGAQNTQQQAPNNGRRAVQTNDTQPVDNSRMNDTPDVLAEQTTEIHPVEEISFEEPASVDRLPVNRFHPASALVGQLFEIPPLEEHWYIQASAGFGQSAITDVAGRSDLIHCYALGAGFYGPAAGRMYLNLGVQGRVDFVQNLSGTVTNPDNTKTDTRYQQLYAIETPLAVGLKYGRNSFAVLVTPGFQLGYTGTYRQYDINDTEIRSERTSGKIASGRTLTMEIGLGYMRKLRPNWYVGANLNTDILRPFGDQTFTGSQRTLPLNGCILLRRTF